MAESKDCSKRVKGYESTSDTKYAFEHEVSSIANYRILMQINVVRLLGVIVG